MVISVSEAKTPRRRRVLFRMVKGLLYGSVFGLFFGAALYLLALAVQSITNTLPINPEAFFALVFAASIVAGIATEYSHWLEESEA